MPKKKPTHRRRKRLGFQTLESRRLLAAVTVDLQNVDHPTDVNTDGTVSAIDALVVMNRIHRGPDETQVGRTKLLFCDVNGDGDVTSLDALRVINRLGLVSLEGNSQSDDGMNIEFRSLAGLGNNLSKPLMGMAQTEFRRLVDSDYTDGVEMPAGMDRPSAREVSNMMSAQNEPMPNDRGMSDFAWQWGQFIDHDIDLTGEGHEPFNIPVPQGDLFFDPMNEGDHVIELSRSEVAKDSADDPDAPMQQMNEISSFIDGSMIYGSDAGRAHALRSFAGGRLRTSEGDLMPFNTGGFDNAGGTGDNLFLAGDVRANEQAGLTAMHTLWVREHNRVADEIAAKNPHLVDESVYQLARAIAIAEIQAITFEEYLPALLGDDVIPEYQGYDPSIDPSISNLFATAAFRYGHTALSSELLRIDEHGNEIEAGNLPLREAFFNPDAIIEEGIDSILMGMASQVSQEIDTHVIDDVRNFLFGPPGSGGFDLAALNIQRGRDHGLPDYNSVREQLGLPAAQTFADITSNLELQSKLEQIYGNVNDIDVWVGALAEDHLDGGSVGELTRKMLVDQFTALRDGDRFWYQNMFEGSQLAEIENTRLSDVIERNSLSTNLQKNVFFVANDLAAE